jgi:hypothetical protein
LDVTYKDFGDLSADTSFCEDASLSVDLLWPVLIPNKYINLLSDKLIGNTIRALAEQVEATREVVAYIKINDGVYFPGKGLSLPSGEIPSGIQSRMHKANIRQQIALTRCRKSATPRLILR